MARPIEPTPTLKGEDAKALKASLERVASSEQIAKRRAAAKAFLASVRSGKPVTTSSGGKGPKR